MMVGALTRCSWMSGEWPDDANGVMAGSERSNAFGEGVMTDDEGLAAFGEGSDGGYQGGGAWALRTRRKGQKQLLVFAFVPLR